MFSGNLIRLLGQAGNGRFISFKVYEIYFLCFVSSDFYIIESGNYWRIGINYDSSLSLKMLILFVSLCISTGGCFFLFYFFSSYVFNF